MQLTLTIIGDRDSVAAGDDFDSHECRFQVPADMSVQRLVHQAVRACQLPSISGGEATWILYAGEPSTKAIAVIAQQWPTHRLLIDGEATAQQLIGDGGGRLFFRYWCQADPDAVHAALAHGLPLPGRY